MQDSREVSYSAKEHTDLVGSILAESHLKPHNIFRHADVRGKRVVDIGCGDGTLCRESINKGAEYALGIDGKPEMIRIASSLNSGDKIRFQESFIEDLLGDESFDIAILSYLLNNARDFQQLLKQVEKTASFLKPGGMAIIYNNNPFDVVGGDFTKYGFRKTITRTHDGAPIIYDYQPAITDFIINYFISPKKHEEAFQRAGFSGFQWAPLQLYPGANSEFWQDYFNHKNLPVIGMVAKK